MVGGFLADRMRRTAIFIGKGGRQRVSPYTTRKPISALSEGTDKTLGSKTRRWRKESSARGTSHLPLNFKHQRMVVNAGAQLASFRARRQEATSGGVRTSRLEPPGEHWMGGRGWEAGKISSMARLLTSWPLATPTSFRDMCSRVTRSSRGKTGNLEIRKSAREIVSRLDMVATTGPHPDKAQGVHGRIQSPNPAVCVTADEPYIPSLAHPPSPRLGHGHGSTIGHFEQHIPGP